MARITIKDFDGILARIHHSCPNRKYGLYTTMGGMAMVQYTGDKGGVRTVLHMRSRKELYYAMFDYAQGLEDMREYMNNEAIEAAAKAERNINDKLASAVDNRKNYTNGATELTVNDDGDMCLMFYDQLIASYTEFTGEVLLSLNGNNTATTHARINAFLRGLGTADNIRTTMDNGGTIQTRAVIGEEWISTPFPGGSFGFYPEDF